LDTWSRATLDSDVLACNLNADRVKLPDPDVELVPQISGILLDGGHARPQLPPRVRERRRPIHIACSPKPEYLAIITAYVPHPEQWSADFKKRK